jgi:signal transduction histidine kinase
MSIKLRLTLLVSLLLLGFLTTYLALRALHHHELEQTAGEERRARAQLLNHWIDLASRALPQFVADAAQSEEFAGQLAQAEAGDARQKIEANLARATIDVLWIVAEDGSLQHAFHAPGRPALGSVPVSAAELGAVLRNTPNPRFHALAGNDLLELAARRLAGHEDSRGWLLAARRWDDAHLRTLAELSESEVSLQPPHELTQPPQPSRLVLSRPLLDARGHAIRTLRVESDLSVFQQSIEGDWRQTQLFLAFGLLVLAAVALALQGWVLRPLGRIGESLGRNDPEPVRLLSKENSELGRLAGLVLTSFGQREALQREINEREITRQALERSESELRRTLEERARLGRDLHDGVIQSLYAAGMGLAGIRTQLRPDQTEAATRLEQTRATLNETIHDVRNFIIGLEPEALKLQTFSQAVSALLETMQSLRPFASTVEIDEALAVRLTLAQRVHALQITREAVSNALRHGLADKLFVTLRLEGVFAEMQIRDDGRGFDPGETASSGNGLRNLAQRARELGAELTVQSQPGEGARVTLVFSLNHYD